MKESGLRCFLVLMVLIAAPLAFLPKAGMAEKDQRQVPPARDIPGSTIEDRFPNGCVDCHINMPDLKQDERISTLMSRWNKDVEANLLKKAQTVARADVTLKGIHPPASQSLKDIPAACIRCHGKRSTKAPPFAELVHAIHLTGGNDNHFLTVFQGECTHCHKMNMATGVWATPTGPEK